MLLLALDGHPEIVAFPFEPSGMASSLIGREIPAVTKEESLANREWLALRVATAVKHGHTQTAEFFSKFDAKAFGSLLRRGGGGSYAADLHRAFLAGIAPANDAYLAGDPYFAVKLPYFMEAAFPEVRTWAPQTRLIHVSRAPLDRYLSCKQRAMAKGPVQPRKGIGYNTFQALLHRSSEAAAARHDQSLSVSYEALVARPRETFEEICDFLNIEWSDSLLQQTRWGAPAVLPSSFGFANDAGDAERRRVAGGMAISSPAERAYHEAVAEGDVATARRHAAEVFPHESAENHAARQALVSDLQAWVDEPERIQGMVLSGRVGIL